MLGWVSKRLIMKQPDCAVGKLELGAWWPAGLGCNQRQPGRCTPTQSCLLILLQGEGVGIALPSTIPSSSFNPPNQAVFSGPVAYGMLPQAQAESHGVPCPQLPILTSSPLPF